jgi:hypothetical protein
MEWLSRFLERKSGFPMRASHLLKEILDAASTVSSPPLPQAHSLPFFQAQAQALLSQNGTKHVAIYREVIGSQHLV